MIKTTTHTNDLLNDEFDTTVFVNQTKEETQEMLELKEVESKVKNIRFEPSQSTLNNILAYASM